MEKLQCDRLRVQPRVCGEYRARLNEISTAVGSTPRMRGILLLSVLHFVTLRFNPAYAGNICICHKSIMESRVQPRVCGEYSKSQYISSLPAGSTPRMRGISIIVFIYLNLIRFNPAYAGNIFKRTHHKPPHQVQPRVCGEYVVRQDKIWRVLGSTPRMRGIYSGLNFCLFLLRFNPAYAGNIRPCSPYVQVS